MERKETKRSSYLKFGLIVFLWLLVIFGLSYAYFAVVFDNDDETTVTAETGKLAVDFITGEYIDNDSMWPTNDEDIFSGNDVSEFTVARSSDNTVSNVYYNIYLEDINITSNYKSAYVKWKLYNVENPTSSSTPIGEGTFQNIGNNTSLQLNQNRITLPDNVTHHYTLYIWISNDANNLQNDLLNGSLEAKVAIIAVTE